MRTMSMMMSRSMRCLSRSVSRRFFFGSSRVASDSIFKHIDSDGNNASTAFDFNEENHKQIKEILAKYPVNHPRSGVIPLLHLAQEQVGGWIPLAAMNRIAEICQVAPMRVYEVSTFYTMFNRAPVGKYHIQVCVTSPCMVVGSDELVEALEKKLGVKMFETTSDGVFTLGEMECMGCCVNAPMIAVADYSNAPKAFSYDYYEDLTIERALEIVDMLKRGEKPPVGPQGKRKVSMPACGKTSLLQPPPGPFCRDLTNA